MSVINANDELYCDVSLKFKDTYRVFFFSTFLESWNWFCFPFGLLSRPWFELLVRLALHLIRLPVYVKMSISRVPAFTET
jgi:hypothetical protein